MVVVPTFAVGQQSEQPIVTTVLTGLVISVTPHVGCRIDRPGDMPSVNGPHNDRPKKERRGKFESRPRFSHRKGQPNADQ